jgi:hypothetical protein
MAVPQDKFIQIAVAAAPNNLLYALDTSGNVWRFDINQNAWRMVPQKRSE